MRSISLEILYKVLVATQREDVPQDYLQILLIMLGCERLAILSVEVFYYIFLLNGCHLPCVYVNTLARGSINYLFNL